MSYDQFDVYKCKGKSKYLLVPIGTDIIKLDVDDSLKEDLEEFGPLDFWKEVKNEKSSIGGPSIEELNTAFKQDGYLVHIIGYVHG